MDSIRNKKYIYIPNFFSKNELKILQPYCKNVVSKGVAHDPQSPLTPSYYKDPLMDSLLIYKKPLVEKISKLKLYETYAYWRYYVYGGTLIKHLDRPSCEISVTACIKKEDNWPIVVEGKEFELKEGEAILYNGLFQKHWRPGVYKGEGMAQVFFHYVNKNGHFTHHQYDSYLKTTGLTKSQGDLKWMKKQ